jgi:hypothetical protein
LDKGRRVATTDKGFGLLRVVFASIIGLLLGVSILLLLRRPHNRPGLEKEEVHARSSAGEQRPGVARTAAPPPRFITRPFADKSPLVSDPKSPDYDVVRLSRLAHLSFGTAFENEPRDPVFAPRREQMLRDTVEADLASVHAASRLLSVECKSATCKLLFAGKDLDEARWGSMIMQYTATGSALEPGTPYMKDGTVISPVFVGFKAEDRPNDAWAKTYPKQRAEHLARAHSHPPPANWPPVPPQ